MVLILSEDADSMTTKVVEWLTHLRTPYIRINKEESDHLQLNLKSEEYLDLTLQFHDKEFKCSDISFVWYRRGYLKGVRKSYFSDFNIPDNFKPLFYSHLNEEVTRFHHLFYFLTIDRCLNHPHEYAVNKLEVLSRAKKIGLNVPPFLICNTKRNVLEFKEKHKSIITKTIQDNLVIKEENYCCSHFAFQLENADIDALPEQFAASFFQKKIDKLYEVRVFYLDGLFYSVAHFNNVIQKEMNPLDGKHLHRSNGDLNRLSRFILKESIMKKVCVLMKTLNMNSGSLDFLVTPDLEFYFLEVNPVGQFDFVSTFGHYHIEYDIAHYLNKKYHDYCPVVSG